MVDYPSEPSMVDDLGLDPAMLVHPDEPSMGEYPMGSDGHTEPGKDDNMMGSRSRRSPRKLSMVENPLEPPMEYPMDPLMEHPMDPLMEYPMDLSMEYPVLYPSMEYPMGPGEHTGPDMEDNMMGARSRRSPREPCNQQTIPEILKCFERQG